MAKKIKFPLEMKDGKKVRTIEEFRKYFDPEKTMMYFLNGKLLGWLEDRHYDKYYETVCKIDSKKDNVLQRICEALEIEFSIDASEAIDLKKVEINNQKIEKIRQYVDDKKILEQLDYIAMNQKDLDKLIKKSCSKIYLFEKNFVLPNSISNLSVVGINNPIVDIDSEGLIDFASRNVYFSGTIFGSKYQKLIDDYNYELEHRNDKKHNCYKASKRLDIRLSDDDRKQSKKLFDLLETELIEVEYDIDAATKVLFEELSKADLFDSFDIDIIGKPQALCIKNAHLDEAFWKFENRNN